MIYCFEDLELDLAARELRRAGQPVHVERQVFEVLSLLVSRAPNVVSKIEMLDEVWAGQFVSESALTSRIKSARRAVGDDGRAQRLIKNVHGVGYRFIGEVELTETNPAPSERIEEAARSTSQRDSRAATLPTERPDVAFTISLDDEFPFVGRDDEIDAVGGMLADPQTRPGVGLFGGEPGVGKSRLAVELAERAAVELGAVVAAGRCDERVAAPLQVWRDIAHQLASDFPEAFARWSVDLPAVRALLAPAGLSPSTGEGEGFDVQIATESLVEFLKRAASEQRVVIVIDDLHWSDESTRMLMVILLRRLARYPVYLLASFRTSADDMPESVGRWLVDWSQSPRVLRFDLTGLDEQAVRDLGTRVLGAGRASAVRGLHSRTNGHGLFVTELIREFKRGADGEGLPASIKAIVEARLARLDENARSLVVAGASLGPEFAVAHAAAVAGLEMSSALAALDRAIRSGLVHEGGSVERFRFSHQLMPAAVVGTQTSPARAALHHRCAEVLEAASADAVEIAQHVLSSVPLTPTEEALARGRAVAAEAHAQLRFDDAIRLLDRARTLDLDERVRCEVELDLGAVMNDAGQGAGAVEVFDQAVLRARAAGWTDLIVRAAFGRGGHGPYRRLLDRGTLALLDEIQQLDSLDDLTRAQARARTAAFNLNWQRYADREAMSADAVAKGRACGARGQSLLQLLEARWIAVGCPQGAAQIDAVDAELVALRAELGVVGSDAGMVETAALWFARGEALRHEAAHYIDPPGSRREIDSWRHDGLNATVAAFEGRFEEAADRFDEAAVRAELCWGDSGPVIHAMAQLFVDALSGTARSVPLLEGVAHRFPTQILIGCHAWSLVLSGERARAREVLDRVEVEALPRFSEHLVGGNGLVAVAEAALALEREDLLRAIEPELEGVQNLVLGLPWAPSFAAAHVLARVVAVSGDEPQAAGHRANAARAYASLGAPALATRLADESRSPR